MSERSRGLSSLARGGFSTARGEEQLRAGGWWDDRGAVDGSQPVLDALSKAADPDLALHGLDRLREALGDGWRELAERLRAEQGLRGRLIGVLGSSTALGDFLVANPELWRRLVASERGRADATEALFDAVQFRTVGDIVFAGLTGNEAISALRYGYRALLLDVAAEDLGHTAEPELPVPSYEHVTARLTELAEAALRAALAVATTEVLSKPGGEDWTPACRLAVIAMGKCGGRELNYVSDVDMVFVGDGDIDVATRMASATMRVAGKAAFEVDAALRPEGKAGALVRTLDGYLSYYKRWARTWEFQALLKARPVAGDAELGQSYSDAVQPMVWSAAERENFVDDVRSMRRRVERHVPTDVADRELKLGRGGLRDVEFAVQLLQMVHGRSDERLRSQSTVEGLKALGDGGYVGREDAAGLGESYEFLRILEHRLQLRKLRRTHLFPAFDDEDDLRWLARSAGIRASRGRAAHEVLLTDFRQHAKRIRRLHEKLFYRPLLEAVARVPTDALRLTTKDAVVRLAALGYAAPDGALKHISALTAGVSRRAAIQSSLLPVLLDLLASAPDPDGGLLAYRRMSEALAATPWYLRLLRDEGAVVQRLAVLLGTSKLVPDLAVRAPEGLRLLADTDALANTDPREVADSLRRAVRRQADLERAVAAARSMRRHELLRVACADLLGLLDVPSVCAALSRVWSAVLQAAFAAAETENSVSDAGPPARIAVIGMGRLGGNELGYSSDADVMFVCESANGASDSDAVRYASSVARGVRWALSSPSQDPPLQVDADLRPEGRGGPLVRTIDSYRRYYRQWGQIWESQALLRARPVAGDEELGERFVAVIDPVRYPEGGLDATKVREIRRIKARVENERMPRGADRTMNTKLGRGGLSDVEWTVQLLQLQHAHRIPGLRTQSTVQAVDRAEKAGLLEASDAEELRGAWLLATKARNATMLVRGKASDQIPTFGRELAAVASVAGDPDSEDPGEFLDEYRRTARRARAVVERVFYEY